MITKVSVTYSDGSEATFTGEPVDLASLPLQSPDQQSQAHPVEPEVIAEPVEPTPAVEEAPVEEAPVETTVEEAA